jgi:putative transcriptional regulator
MSGPGRNGDPIGLDLVAYVLGHASADEAACIEAAAAKDPGLSAELDALREVLGQVGAAAVAPVPAPPALWARIESNLDRPRPFATFTARVAEALRIGERAARALLDRIDLATSWSDGPSASCKLYHIEPGPSLAAVSAIAGFVRVLPGQEFPVHTHHGDELVIVLQGGFRDEDGTDVFCGQSATKPAGSRHRFVAHLGDELIYLAVILGAVEFDEPFSL